MENGLLVEKLALIVNAGLAALALKTLPPSKAKDSVLGFFPVLGRLIEEDDFEDGGPPQPVPGAAVVADTAVVSGINVDSDSDYGNADDKGSDCDVCDPKDSQQDDSDGDEAGGTLSKETLSSTNPGTAARSKHSKTSRLLELTTKLDVVIKQITRSAAQRANFDRVACELKVKVPPLIAGYGIRWNIKYQSHKKAIEAREVIDQILKEDQQEDGAGDFGEAYFSPRDWKEIDNLNCELEVFVKMTADMEGNSATGTHVIPKYLELKEDLAAKILASKEAESLYPMYHAMLKRVERYLNEALQCETLVMATIMHLCYRVHLFELAYGVGSFEVTEAMDLLKQHFDFAKLSRNIPEINLDADVVKISKPSSSEIPPSSIQGQLTSRMTQQPTAPEDEIEAYLKADIPFSPDDLDHKTTPLTWWKANQNTYPTLAILACWYLGASGSSCSVKRLFSAASDSSSSSSPSWLCRDLPFHLSEPVKDIRSPYTMAHSVSSLMWLREDTPLTGDFLEAGNALKALLPSKKSMK
ncbi:hypothetical protein PGTUg99_026247 [Puccinia graminis f. sp. tritici]|uniref:HAT C-terminal dimerisation domain-containing protein n=1 Tax=Puccinia graminis f. sp. tritici TaxID=56615 RepID=A0A5B0RMX3_PUCGR|nr:hypothetical protein PGTUg99_026247 [Puccinia graminis f. sp. tritici]